MAQSKSSQIHAALLAHAEARSLPLHAAKAQSIIDTERALQEAYRRQEEANQEELSDMFEEMKEFA